MDAQQQSQLFSDQMEEKIDRERAIRVEEATEAFDRFQEEHEARVVTLDFRLYHVEGGGPMAANAVMASDEELSRMLNAAIRPHSYGLAKVVFGEAVGRNLPEVVERYCTEMDPEARELLEERRQALSPEDLERRRGDIETLFGKPDLSGLHPKLLLPPPGLSKTEAS
jgi:hypothetical protein